MPDPVLAIDVGATKLAVALVEPSGRVAGSHRAPTPAADGETLLRALLGPVDDLLGGRSVVGVGVGCSGPMRWPAGEVSPLNIRGWQEFPLRARLQEHFPGVPVRLHNDAVCTAVGEHWRGSGKGRDHLLGMVVSSGVGGGLVLGGRLVDGASGNAGHVGHVVVDPSGPACSCGGLGCLEAIASGPRLAAWARERGWSPRGEGSARDLAVDAARGHPVALQALERAGAALGVAIASATALCDLDVVAVGGGLAQAGPLLFEPLEVAYRRHARLSFTRRVRVVPAQLGQQAGLVGAAALVLGGDRYWSAD